MWLDCDCAPKDCHNTSLKGVKMCYFSSDLQQRAKWIKNIGQENWFPNKHLALYEVICLNLIVIYRLQK